MPDIASVLVDFGGLVGAVVVGLVLYKVIYRLLNAANRRLHASRDSADRREMQVVDAVLQQTLRPASIVFPLLVVLLALRSVPLSPQISDPFRHGIAIALITAASWWLVRAINAGVAVTLSRYDVSARDNLRARKVHTQLRVVTRIVTIVVWFIGVAAILMTFPSIRQLGTSILASAGLAGLILGLAAQRTIGNFLAGIQIAITQPIRLDDAVVISGEWGWIEEISSTYVVVKIWDERRLIIPFSTLLDQPFQNWTRNTAHLIGSVMIWADYSVPVQEVREELKRILESTDLWDGRVGVLQVVETSDRAVQLRALVSAADSPTAWDLRCYVREKLVEFLQRQYPACLPTLRAIVGDRTTDVAGGTVGGVPGPVESGPETGGLPGEPERAETPVLPPQE